MKLAANPPHPQALYQKRNAIGLLAYLLIEQHEVFLNAGCSLEVDESFDSLSATFFGHRESSPQTQYHYRRLRARLNGLATPDMLKELDRNFSKVFKQNSK